MIEELINILVKKKNDAESAVYGTYDNDMEHFYQGQYEAFEEIITLLKERIKK